MNALVGIHLFSPIALITGLHSGEIINPIWVQIDLIAKIITVAVPDVKRNLAQIPISAELERVLSAHAKWFAVSFGTTRSEYFLFPFGKPAPQDPSRPMIIIKTGLE